MIQSQVRLDPSKIPLKQHLARWTDCLGKGARARSLTNGLWQILGTFDIYRLAGAEIAVGHVSPFEYHRPPVEIDKALPTVAITICLSGEISLTYNRGHSVRAYRGQVVLSNADVEARGIAEQSVRYMVLYLHGTSMLAGAFLTEANPAVEVSMPSELWQWTTGTVEFLRGALRRGDTTSVVSLMKALEISFDQLARPALAQSMAVDDERILAIQAFVDENVRDPNLGVDMLCRRFHVSRATLYRQMAGVGGVKRYLQQRRLILCFDELRKSLARDENYQRALARAYQFRSLSDFTERYRSQFGVDPMVLLKAEKPMPPPPPAGTIVDGTHIFRMQSEDADNS